MKSFAKNFPMSEGNKNLKRIYEKGFSQHSFRRTWSLGLMQQQGQGWCERHIKEINGFQGWKLEAKHSQFWNYVKDSEFHSVKLPPICTEFTKFKYRTVSSRGTDSNL